ncbi:membrane protein [Bacteroidales bacterium]|nr:membrane protein [Bacteroidales bacterium]
MKKYLLYILFIPFTLSCADFLDRNPLDRAANEVSWVTERDAQANATGCYEGWSSMNDVVYFDCASDNAYNPFYWEEWQYQASGLGSASAQSGHFRNFMEYDRITRCNNFLENINRPKMSETLRERLSAEVRFIRAWHYFRKVSVYGDVPLVKKVLPLAESNLPKNPKQEVMQFIIDEMKEIAPKLDEKYSGDNVGRITKGAAITLKAKTELLDKRYAECEASCKEIMNLNYALFPSYVGLFKIANENNSEVILDVQYIENLVANRVLGQLIPNSNGGWCSINPTQSLADAYEDEQGELIEKSTIYDPKEPYLRRDPRLAATLVYPGCLYEGAYFNPIDKDDPTSDYYAPYNRTKTGYTPRKYLDNLSDYRDVWNTGMNAIIFRYADVLLMYAECKIEQSNIDAEVYEAIDKVRLRAGMPRIDQVKYNNVEKMRELLRRERRVELAMEGWRWFDICRWEIGEETMPGNVEGALLGKVNPTTGALTLTNERIFVEKRVFDKNKHYLWPIPQDVIDKTPLVKQNPNY